MRATLDVARRRGTRENSALLATVALSYLILPLLLLALAVVADSWRVRAALVAGAVGVLVLGVILRTTGLFDLEMAWRRNRAGGADLAGRPPLGHAHHTAAGWQPAVTVVVTAHNDSRFLGSALTSLIEQDFGDFECIVIDDGSTDLTIDVASAFSTADTRFRVVQHEGDAGLPAARNTGLSYARAPWVTFLDADDFLWPSALSRRLDAVSDDPECAGAYCDWRAVPPDSSPRQKPSEARALHRATFPDAQWETPFIASAPVLRTASVRALGGFSEDLHSAEDFEFYLRLLRAGYWINYARYVGIGYRQVPGSMIRANPALHFEVVRSVVDAVEREIDPAAIPGSVAPYIRPMSYYVRETKVLRRQLRFLALATRTGHAEQVERILARLDRDLLRHPLPFDPVDDPYRYAVQRLGLQHPAQAAQRQELRQQLTTTLGPLLRTARDSGAPAASAPSAEPGAGLNRRTVLAKTGRRVGVRELHRPPQWVTGGLEDHARGTVMLIAQSRYHVDELGPLAEELAARGVATSFMVTDSAPATVLTELSKYTDVVLSWDAELPDRCPVAAVVVLNDWGPTRRLVECADRHGVPTFGKVEGVQDYTDVDTGQQRLPYRQVRYVLGQGANDAKALADRDVFIVGSSRLERIWQEPASTPGQDDPVLINFNFTYNVLTDHSDAWILSAQGGIEDAGREFLVSQHPALTGQALDAGASRHGSTHPLRGRPFSRSGVPVQHRALRGHGPRRARDLPQPARRAGARLPAPARRLPEDHQQGRAAGRRPGFASWQVDYRDRCATFFAEQIDVDPDRRSETRGAELIAGLL